jgi:hypothetical protein
MVGACCGQHHCDTPSKSASSYTNTLKVAQS